MHSRRTSSLFAVSVLTAIAFVGAPALAEPPAKSQPQSRSQPQSQTTRFDYRIEPLVDFYHYVREQVTRRGESDAPEELAAAVAAAGKLRETLGSSTLAWEVLDQHLAQSTTAAELKKAFEGIPEKVRTFRGETIEIRDAAVAFAAALEAAEPAYRRLLWPKHEAALRAARKSIEERFQPKEAECVRYMVDSLGLAADPGDLVPVYLVHHSTWPGAYTIRQQGGAGLVFVSVAGEEFSGTLLFEIILHEATHALDIRTRDSGSVFKQIREGLEAAGMSPRDRNFRNIPHTIMFIQAGETIRRLVSKEHVHYGEPSGYYGRMGEVAEVERPLWTAYLDGKMTREAAVAEILRALTAKKAAKGSD